MKYIVVILISICFCCQLTAQSVYKTPSGKKYHKGNCRMVENTSTKLTLEKACDIGLTPCKFCKPAQLIGTKQINKVKPSGVQQKSVRCKGRTKKGTHCKHLTRIKNGYCYQHQPE